MTNKKKVVEDQRLPEKNQNAAIWDLVIEDMKSRDQVGLERYGTRLQAFNKRNSAIDAYQEGLDLVVYMRQMIEERNQIVKTLKSMLNWELEDHIREPIEQILKGLGEA